MTETDAANPSRETKPTLTIVIPALNEEEAIATTIQNCIDARPAIVSQTCCGDVEIILVSDGSTDRTVEIAQQFQDEIAIEIFPENRGYGAALKHGFAVGKGELVSFLDGDSTCDAMNFIPMINKLIETGADVCLGSRMGPDSEMPWIRRLGNWFFKSLLVILARSKVRDTASGMRVIRRDSLPQLYPLPDGLHFTPAMSCRALLDPKLSIEEIDMSYAERVGKSKLSVLKDGLRFLYTIAEISLTYQPIYFFGLPGLFFLLLSLGYGLSPVLYYIQHTQVPEDRIYRLLSVVTFAVAGIMLAGMGLLANRLVAQMQGYYEPKVRKSFANRFSVVGLGLIVLGIGINIKPLYQYLTLQEILEHWSYLTLGALFVLSGLQIFCYSVLELMLDKLWEARRFREEFQNPKKTSL